MGYYLVMGSCIGCGQVFSFNPIRVPLSRAVTGQREPICKTCVDRMNKIRIKVGLAPLVPAADAYEAVDEGEL